MRKEQKRKGSEVNSYVLDTYALQAFLAAEPGADSVRDLLVKTAAGKAKVYVSWISLTEVYYVTHRRSAAGERELLAANTIEGLKRLTIDIVPAGEAEAMKAGAIKAKYPLSLADAFVAALGQMHNAEVVTGDPEFRALEEAGEIDVFWLPQKPKAG